MTGLPTVLGGAGGSAAVARAAGNAGRGAIDRSNWRGMPEKVRRPRANARGMRTGRRRARTVKPLEQLGQHVHALARVDDGDRAVHARGVVFAFVVDPEDRADRA